MIVRISVVDLPKRKIIRLPEYDYSSPGAYFVTICTKDRKCILSNISVGADSRSGTSSLPALAAKAPPVPLLTRRALGGPNLQLTDTGKIVEQYILSTDRIPGFHVDKYVVMPNHIHMILRIENGPPGASAPTNDPQTRAGEPSDRPICAAGPAAPTVSDAVGALKRLVNRKLGHDIWQRSYHEHVIRNENDYREIWAYIDANPAKWAEDRYYEGF